MNSYTVLSARYHLWKDRSTANLLNYAVRIKSHMLAGRIVVDVVIADSTKRGIELDWKSGLTAYGATCDWYYCQRRPTRYTAYQHWYSNLDSHA